MSTDGTRELEQKLNAMSQLNPRQAVASAIQTVRSAAALNCPTDTGELKQSIFSEVTEQNESIVGACWTDKAYAPYVEFGTGPKGQDRHEGIAPDITPAYTQSPWWIHESQIDQRIAEKYRWFYIDTPKGRFYQCTGQPAHPFMYPALENNKETILEGMKATFRVDLEGK